MIMLVRTFHKFYSVQSRHGNQYVSQRTHNFLCFPILPLYPAQYTALVLNPNVNCVNVQTIQCLKEKDH